MAAPPHIAPIRFHFFPNISVEGVTANDRPDRSRNESEITLFGRKEDHSMPLAKTTPQPFQDLGYFQVDSDRGFLPSTDPLCSLSDDFMVWEEMGQQLPKLLGTGKIRSFLDTLPVPDIEKLKTDAEYERAMLLLSYFGHGYVWGEPEPPAHIPANIAVSWYRVAKRLGRPPILSYASYALNNWRRIEPEGPVSLGNIVLLQNFLGGIDEEWFILIHVEIEAKASQALRAIVTAQKAVLEDRARLLDQQLVSLACGVERMYEILLRMPENCDPFIYYHRVRPYIHGWKDHPAMPDGLIYEGVHAYGGKPQQFRGETGAQSSIIPSLDAALGIQHADDPLRPYLMEMRDYMPPKQRAFIEAVEHGPSIRQYVRENLRDHPYLRKSYNECVEWIERFRSRHLEYAALYVQKQSMRSPYNPTERGTGGTPFLPYLKKHRDETAKHMLE